MIKINVHQHTSAFKRSSLCGLENDTSINAMTVW